MKKLYLLFIGILFSTAAFADSDLSTLLDKVVFPLRAEKWVTTKTADVFVGVNAAVTDAGIEKLQNQILSQLMQLSNQGEWHIVSYNRQQDKSGLESIQISAEARLPQSELVNLRSKAKAMSKPGNTFTIDDVQFTPSDDEITQGNALLRSTIYQMAKAEIDTLNKMYPEQKYYLYRIDFITQPVVMPMAMSMRNNQMAAAVAASPLNVGGKLEMQATVTVASMPDLLAKKAALTN